MRKTLLLSALIAGVLGIVAVAWAANTYTVTTARDTPTKSGTLRNPKPERVQFGYTVGTTDGTRSALLWALTRLREGAVGLHDLAALLVADALPAVLVPVDQKHVLHGALLRFDYEDTTNRTGPVRHPVDMPRQWWQGRSEATDRSACRSFRDVLLRRTPTPGADGTPLALRP